MSCFYCHYCCKIIDSDLEVCHEDPQNKLNTRYDLICENCFVDYYSTEEIEPEEMTEDQLLRLAKVYASSCYTPLSNLEKIKLIS